MAIFSIIARVVYKGVLKPVLFRIDAEKVHEGALSLGSLSGRTSLLKALIRLLSYRDSRLAQSVGGVDFENPVGLAAGFDYEAKLTQILPPLGFGYMTIGTITNNPFEGNPKPRLGRLPRSKALLVNKGYKNPGVNKTLKSLSGAKFEIPVGISIGATNSPYNENEVKATEDIVKAFKVVKISDVSFAYYELNISCPNLSVCLDFYTPENLKNLLEAVISLGIDRPLFVKMPIVKTNDEVREMLRVIVRYPISAVIFGNLQKDKDHPSLDKSEVAKSGKGNFSGKPTEERSNELIELSYREFGSKLKIIGCGGVFSAEDAYKKIKLGASMVQLITGMIFEGPQLIGEINRGIAKAIESDGYKSLSEAVGSGVK